MTLITSLRKAFKSPKLRQNCQMLSFRGVQIRIGISKSRHQIAWLISWWEFWWIFHVFHLSLTLLISSWMVSWYSLIFHGVSWFPFKQCQQKSYGFKMFQDINTKILHHLEMNHVLHFATKCVMQSSWRPLPPPPAMPPLGMQQLRPVVHQVPGSPVLNGSQGCIVGVFFLKSSLILHNLRTWQHDRNVT